MAKKPVRNDDVTKDETPRKPRRKTTAKDTAAVTEVAEQITSLVEKAKEADEATADAEALEAEVGNLQKEIVRLRGENEKLKINAGISAQDLLNLQTIGATVSFGRVHTSGEFFVTIESKFIGRKIRQPDFLSAVQQLRSTPPNRQLG